MLKYVAVIKTNILFVIKIYLAGCIILNMLDSFNSLFMKISYNSFHLKFIPTVAWNFGRLNKEQVKEDDEYGEAKWETLHLWWGRERIECFDCSQVVSSPSSGKDRLATR
jgi:hypothetical protein